MILGKLRKGFIKSKGKLLQDGGKLLVLKVFFLDTWWKFVSDIKQIIIYATYVKGFILRQMNTTFSILCMYVAPPSNGDPNL
jgi:hypothetical protein